MALRRNYVILAATIGLLLLGAGSRAQAQSSDALSGGLPAPLAASVRSGDTASIKQLIAASAPQQPQLAALLAERVVLAAERLVSVNPQVAVAVAVAALDVVKEFSVQTSAPLSTNDVIASALRIAAQPAVHRAAPTAVAQMTALAVSVLSNSVVYLASPDTSMLSMANAHTAASSPQVIAAAPWANDAVTQSIKAARQDPALTEVFANSFSGNAIFADPNATNAPVNRVPDTYQFVGNSVSSPSEALTTAVVNSVTEPLQPTVSPN